MRSSCTVKQCSIWKRFGHNQSNSFQKSKTDIKSENRTTFSQSCEFSSFCGSGCSKSQELICVNHKSLICVKLRNVQTQITVFHL